MTASLDAVILGGGIAGLTAGLVLASAGQRVAVLEQDRQLGGYATSFRRRGYTFDSAVDGISGLGTGGPLRRLLEYGGVDLGDLVLDLEVARSARFGAERLDFPARGDRCRRFLRDRFPREGAAIDRASEMLLSIFAVASRSTVAQLWDGLDLPRDPLFLRWRDRTYADLLEESGVREPLLRLALCERLMFLGEGPERVSAVSVAMLLGSTWTFGTQRVRGGLYRLVNAIVAAIRARGGKVLAAEAAEAVAPVARGFETTAAKGTYRSSHVVAAVDPVGFFDDLWRGAPPGGDALARARAFPRSCSFFLLYAGARGAWPEAPPSIGIFADPSRPDFEDSGLEGPAPVYGAAFASNADSTLAPEGCATATLHAFLRAGTSLDAAGRARLESRALELLDRLAPGVAERTEVRETAAPATLERYTRNPGGAAYGFAQVPGRFLLARDLAACAPPGVHLAGHWTGFGGGVLSSALSGFAAAREILASPPARSRAPAG